VQHAPTASVILAPASGPDVGGGHVLRCLSFAHSLQRLGAECAFVIDPYGAGVIRRFSSAPISVHHDMDAALSGASERPLVVVDDYACSAAIETRFRPYARRILAIDDLADRRHDADLLLDPGYGRDEADYKKWVPNSARLLLGPRYALLRPAFVQLRQQALARSTPAAPNRIFISFGLSDINAIAAQAARLVLAYDRHVEIDLALASDAASLPVLMNLARSESRLNLHIDATNVANLIAQCDLAIGAGGSSTWERMCLGRPTLAIAVADNQRVLLRTLKDDGLLVAADLDDPEFETTFVSALDHLWLAETRRILSVRSAEICDGLGAERAAEALLGS